MMALTKKIFFVLFFFQLSVAVAANADTILKHYNRWGSTADDISRLHHNLINIAQQQELSDDSPESGGSQNSHACVYVRFVHVRTNYSAILQPANQSLSGIVTSFIKQEPKQNIVREAFLPAYYSFLFRLSPF
ncbi:hypothetical protein [Mucilaginibacter ginsenosidivorax]|uniref:Uncharacterized protein n=1 Tax=Mucilaginibacter ginsenosidivorax TaxID=862126 RepID=A0A5B8W3K5_9SPHI|nr:hypothetical protein [Mucilaginibacter ginsenosidivorax]QEC76888.1 hypothetical protein FSB76_13385 [Mucilaginibacter ginsenosidivorax]